MYFDELKKRNLAVRIISEDKNVNETLDFLNKKEKIKQDSQQTSPKPFPEFSVCVVFICEVS